MRVIGILGSRSSAGPSHKKDRDEPTMKRDGYEVISRCPDYDYRKDVRRGTYMSPTRDHIFQPEDD